jgi:hypothetical protein
LGDAKSKLEQFAVDARRTPKQCSSASGTGSITGDEIKLALGEKLDIWPESIREMAEED